MNLHREVTKSKQTETDFVIDWLKTIAIIGVLFIHTSSGGSVYPVSSFNWIYNLFWGVLFRASVPIFLMCSGALMLNPQKAFTVKSLYTKNILRLIIAMYFWGMVYKIFDLLGKESISVQNIVQSVQEVLLFNQEFHLYYIHIILLVYVFLPVTRIFVKNADQKYLQYFILVWFCVGIFYPTVRPYWPFMLLSGIPAQWLLNMTYASIGYGILGYYLRNFSVFPRLMYVILGFSGFVAVFAGTWYVSAKDAVFYQGFLEGMSAGVCFMAAGIFGFFSSEKASFGIKTKNVISFISKAAFCIYLVHIFFIRIFQHFGIDILIMPSLMSIPLLVFANLFCSSFVYIILSRIPIVKKYLV